ncbi:MAG: haloacid dehalogenase-like hydrolase [Tenericutes bacterium ADurb.Bin239]|nr:MAG: haloacid dehalogenase-like hydrolase [Tenericutes bacterium ADurb.Bin239]
MSTRVSTKKPIIAIIYDFDKTLTTTDMQNYNFIPALGMTPEEFWGETGKFSDRTGVERILSYMYMMIVMARDRGISLTREFLYQQGKSMKYFDGVLTWFDRINAYGESKGIKIEHYLISSGTKEIIEGSEIAKHFKAIFGCEFYFDPKTKLPVWPKLAINYTAKTQFYFRITKGILDTTEDTALNRKLESHRIPHRNIIYIGDGMTDVPVMLLVKQNGGHSIAVYPKGERDKVEYLYTDGRVNFVARADYTEKSDINSIVRLIVDQVCIAEQIEKKKQLLN